MSDWEFVAELWQEKGVRTCLCLGRGPLRLVGKPT